MSLADSVLAVNDDLPIRTDKPVHSGKVRSVYWLTDADSRRLIKEKNYPVAEDTPLAVMVISDRISAFDCIFHGEQGLNGIPGKGAALNTISNYWFDCFKEQGLADSHNSRCATSFSLDCAKSSSCKSGSNLSTVHHRFNVACL